jgi:hypothetical protein
MDTDINVELAARLKRLDAGSAQAAPAFDYQGMLERHAGRKVRARRRLVLARGAAITLLIALVGASFWRLDEHTQQLAGGAPLPAPAQEAAPRIVRADTYLALATLEDHIAGLDDAINVARAYSPRGEEIARLERTRAELLDSYAQVRYAELVSANF